MSWLAVADLALRNGAVLLIVKMTFVLALASVVASVARRSSAARRHTMWFAALSSCLWLALTSPIVPSIAIHSPIRVPSIVATTPQLSVAAATREAKGATPMQTIHASRQLSRPGTPAIANDERFLIGRVLVALWVIGVLLLMVRHAIGLVATVRIARRACIAHDPETAREIADVAAMTGARQTIRVGYSAEVSSPVTFNTATPYVLLPIDARSWTTERRRAVLLHEAAHIARRDWLTQAIGRFACELFWFHPLMWRALTQLRNEAERAADDFVLRSGMPPVTYAEHLLELARRATQPSRDLVAIGIVSTNDLERRFVAMFDAGQCRRSVTARGRALTASVALAVVGPLASMRLVAPESRAPHATSLHVQTEAFARGAHSAATVRDSMRVLPMPAVRVIPSSERMSDAPAASLTIPALAPPVVVRPDLSGTWTASWPADDFVTEWTVAQSRESISFDMHGHQSTAERISRLHNITFDGAQSRGAIQIGDLGLSVVVKAAWEGDTLVVTTYGMVVAGSGINDVRMVERMTLSADGNTLIDNAWNVVNGVQPGTSETLELRRVLK